MKRIIEVERGQPAPSTAKWLKDLQKQTDNKRITVPSGDGGYCYEDIPIYTTYDVFEYEDGLDEKGSPIPRVIGVAK